MSRAGLLVCLFVALADVGCGGTGEAQCSADSDCVAASCCAASEAVPVDQRAPCAAAFCNADVTPCTDDEPGIHPICRVGACVMEMPPWCPLVAAVR